MDPLAEIIRLAGVKQYKNSVDGSNISITGHEKAQIMRENGIKPGTQEWFRLWFSKPYLTGEKPLR